MSDAGDRATSRRDAFLRSLLQIGEADRDTCIQLIGLETDLKIPTRETNLKRWVTDGFVQVNKLGHFELTNGGKRYLAKKYP